MEKRSLCRRELLCTATRLLVIGSSSMLLHGCKKPELLCDDVSGLSEEDTKLRGALQYQDRSPFGKDKICSKCAFFREAGDDQCGACTLVRGPIHPLGYCSSWAQKG